MATETKACKHCNVEKPLDSFHRQKTTRDGFRHICKPCSNVVCNAHYHKNRESSIQAGRRYKIKKAYGITLDQFYEMLALQGGCCALCRTTTPGGLGRFHVDHSHATGAIRGLLCHSCNTGLGHFRDNTDILQRAIDYLKRSRP